MTKKNYSKYEAKEELVTLSFNHVLLHKKDTKIYQVIFLSLLSMKPPNFFPKKTPFSQHFVIIALFPVTFFSYLKEKGDSFTKTVAHSRF